jgi:hypothetical protein
MMCVARRMSLLLPLCAALAPALLAGRGTAADASDPAPEFLPDAISHARERAGGGGPRARRERTHPRLRPARSEGDEGPGSSVLGANVRSRSAGARELRAIREELDRLRTDLARTEKRVGDTDARTVALSTKMERQTTQSGRLRGELMLVRQQLTVLRQVLQSTGERAGTLEQQLAQESAHAARLRSDLRRQNQGLTWALVLSLLALAVAVLRGRKVSRMLPTQYFSDLGTRIREAEARLRTIEGAS